MARYLIAVIRAIGLMGLLSLMGLLGLGCGKPALKPGAPFEVVETGAAMEESEGETNVRSQETTGGEGLGNGAVAPDDEAAIAAAVARGHDAFYTYGWWHCHELGDEEPPGMRNEFVLGPDLADVGSRLNFDEILREIQRPNDVIAEPRDLHVEDGVSRMPAFADPLAEDDMRDIALYLSHNRRPAAAAPDPGIIEVTEETYAGIVERTQEPLLLYFWAEWCFRCLALSPALEKVAPNYAGRLKIGKIEVDQNPHLVEALVPDQMFPCMVLVKNGEVVDRKYATNPEVEPETFFREWFDEVLH